MKGPTEATNEERQLVGEVLRTLLRPRATPPQLERRFSSLTQLHGELRLTFGFRLVAKRLHYALPRFEDGNRSRSLLIWRRGRVIVKAKPRGEGDKREEKPSPTRHRYGLPHLSLCLVHGGLGEDGTVDISLDAELCKFDCRGNPHSKGPPKGRTPNAMTRSLQESWADDTHFLFADLVCDESEIGRLQVDDAGAAFA